MENVHGHGRCCASQTQVDGMETRQLIESESNGINDNINQNGMEGRLKAGQDSLGINGNIDKNGLEGRLSSQVRSNHLEDTVERFGFQNLEKTDRAEQALRGKLDSSSDRLSAQIDRNAGAINCGFKDSLLQNCQQYGELLLDSSKNAAAAALASSNSTHKIIENSDNHFRDVILQAANNASALQATVASGICKVELQAANNFAAIQLEASKNTCAIEVSAAKNAAEIAKQLAECCCELRSLVTEKACKTDELLHSIEATRIRDELAKTREELNALRIRATLPPPLTGSIPL